MCSNVETNLSLTCLVSGLLNFEHPSVLLFCLETIHRNTLQHFPLNPLQKNTRIPFQIFNAPLKIREHLEFKRITHKTNKEGNSKDVKDPSDLFEVDGKPTEKIYMLGEA